MEIVRLSTAGRKQLSCPAGAEVKNTVSPTLWPERQSTAAALPSFYEGSRWPSWPCTDGEAVHIVLYACVSKIGGQPRFKSNHFSRLHASFVTYMLIYLSIPFSLCLCFLDISKPPPQAPCTGRNTFTTVRTIISDELDSWCWYFPALKVALRPREATCCTFHRCLQFHWWDQRPHRRWCRRWRSRTLEHSPANQKHHKDICWNSMSYVQVVMFILSCDCRHQRDGLKHVFVVFVDRSNNPIETAALVLYKLTSTTLLCRVCLIVPGESLTEAVSKWEETLCEWTFADVHLLLGLYYFGFQISRNDPPSRKRSKIHTISIYLILYLFKSVCGSSMWNKPLICVQKDQVLSPKAQSGTGFLDGIVALQEQKLDQFGGN